MIQSQYPPIAVNRKETTASPMRLIHTPSRVSRVRLQLPRRSLARWRRSLWLKNWFDRVAAAVILVLSLPVLLGAMLLVKLTSRGPAVYSQKRIGQFGQVFTIYKVRTMYHQCESLTGPRWSTPGDPRITPVGRVLRKLHIDELPQLWNVLRGEMSLIGPRPERPEIGNRLTEAIEGYNDRSMIKPGITGYAQIYLPPDTCLNSVQQKLLFDCYYIRHASTWMDLRILACTGLKLVGIFQILRRHYTPRIEPQAVVIG